MFEFFPQLSRRRTHPLPFRHPDASSMVAEARQIKLIWQIEFGSLHPSRRRLLGHRRATFTSLRAAALTPLLSLCPLSSLETALTQLHFWRGQVDDGYSTGV